MPAHMSALLGAALLAGLVVHEVLLWWSARRGRTPGIAARLGRWALLAGTLAVAVGFGHVIDLEWPFGDEPTYPTAFTPAGDPGLIRLASGQQPQDPYPEDGNRAAVEAWRDRKIAALRALLAYPGPGEAEVPFEVLAEEDLGDVRRTLIAYRGHDGTKIPAYVCEPRDHGPVPGVLTIPGHGVGIIGPAGLVPDDYQHGSALELARAGFVALTSESRGFGLLGERAGHDHRAVAYNAIVSGSSYKAEIARDLALALTLLQRWPGVDSERIAVAGASLGGELATLMAVLDPRIRVAVVHAYGGNLGPIPGRWWADPTKPRKPPHGCHLIPGINLLVVREDWLRLIAPRPLLLVRGDRDSPDTMRQCTTTLARLYTRLGVPEAFHHEEPKGGHEFFVAPAVRFLNRWVK